MSKSVYQVINDKIIEIMKQGVIPWKQAWRDMYAPENYYTGYKYRGINLFLLTAVSESKGYSNRWLTFRQIITLGGKLKAYSKGYPVVFWKMVNKPKNDDLEETTPFPLLKYYIVFNSSECYGLPVKSNQYEYLTEEDRISRCEKVIRNYKDCPEIVFGNFSPSYQPNVDIIKIPTFQTFKSADEYYSAIYHELVHSTGHPTRLNRTLVTNSTSESYSKEELIAELGSAYLCSETKIDNNVIENQTAYIQSWLTTLKDDPTLLLQASSKAEKSVKYILNKWEEFYVERFNRPEERSKAAMSVLH